MTKLQITNQASGGMIVKSLQAGCWTAVCSCPSSKTHILLERCESERRERRIWKNAWMLEERGGFREPWRSGSRRSDVCVQKNGGTTQQTFLLFSVKSLQSAANLSHCESESFLRS